MSTGQQSVLTLTGLEPSLSGWRFSVKDGLVRVEHDSTAGQAELAPILVRALDNSATHGPLPVRALEVDQTNESFIVDDRWIVKLITRWGTADRSSILERLLAASHSDDVPRFVGSIEWDHPDFGVATVALVSDFIAGTSDGWTWAADDVITALSEAAHPTWPSEVGRLAARVHTDLNNTEKIAALQISETSTENTAVDQSVDDSLADLYDDRVDSAALRIRNRIDALHAAMKSLPPDWDPKPIITHGDLHVGQIIRALDDKYYLLDFDGNPHWEPGSLLHKEPVERDLAHMLNSIDLVAVVAQKRMGRVSDYVWDWADDAGTQFLAAYSAELSRLTSPITYNRAALPALQAEQLISELRYAADFLPEWEYAPNGAISHRYISSATLEEPLWTPPNSSTT